MKTILLTILLIALAHPVLAMDNSKTVCKYNGKQRTIEVIYTHGDYVPCAVQYTKDTSTETLWQAQLEIGYCEEKAAQLIKRHRGWGWQCVEVHE